MAQGDSKGVAPYSIRSVAYCQNKLQEQEQERKEQEKQWKYVCDASDRTDLLQQARD